MLAVKIFDRDATAVTTRILAHLSSAPDVGVELANYGDGGFGELNDTIAALAPARKSIHLHHDAYSLLDFVGDRAGDALAALDTEMAFAERLRIGAGAVIHVARTAAVPHATLPGTGDLYPVGYRPDHDAVIEAVSRAAPHIGRCGPLFIENTMEDTAWFRELFRRLDDVPVERGVLGMCLDVGHCKVWGGAPLSTWLDLCEDLVRSGRPLHAHIHANDGVKDRHYSLVDADGMGLLAPNPPFCPDGLLAPLRRLLELVGPDHFVLEISSKKCLENLAWSRAALA